MENFPWWTFKERLDFEDNQTKLIYYHGLELCCFWFKEDGLKMINLWHGNKRKGDHKKMKVELIGYLADPYEEARRKHERKIRKENFKYFLKQKLIGLLMVTIGIVAVIITAEGITATMFLVPFGLAMVFNSEKMITESEKDDIT